MPKNWRKGIPVPGAGVLVQIKQAEVRQATEDASVDAEARWAVFMHTIEVDAPISVVRAAMYKWLRADSRANRLARGVHPLAVRRGVIDDDNPTNLDELVAA